MSPAISVPVSLQECLTLDRCVGVEKCIVLTPISLLLSCKHMLLFVGLETSSRPTSALKSLNGIFVWYTEN